MAIPEVTVASPVNAEVRDYEYFTGRVDATQRVEIRTRVSGTLVDARFTPGAEIEANAVVAEIDPQPFAAELERAAAHVSEAQARADRTEGTFKRIAAAREKGASSQEEFEKSLGDRNEAAATLAVARAARTLAQLNLDFCSIRTPITGRIGDRLIDPGNLVLGGNQGSTLLTTVVAVDPVQIAFSMDEITLQRIKQSQREGRLDTPEELNLPIEVGLAVDANEYPWGATLNFINNEVDAKSGTIRLKATCPNPRQQPGGRVFDVGMFVRIRVPVGSPRQAILVPESALGSDQGNRFLMLVDANNKVQRWNVRVGLQQGELREIRDAFLPGDAQVRSLTPADRVIVRGLQRVRSGMTVAVP
jgi:RND family efflux transporter MFP subunit